MKNYSLKTIQAALDPVTEWRPKTILDTARRLHWERHLPTTLDEPLRPISLRHIAGRIGGPQTERLRFLSYNTYLLTGFSPPIGRWIDDTIGWDALSWFGIPYGGALLAILGIVPIPGLALGAVLKAAGLTPSKVIKQVTNIDLNDLGRIGGKPTLNQRADVIGRHLVGSNVYDVCCLSEVFAEDTHKRILSSLDNTWDHRMGPDASGAWTIIGSGLLFLARKWPIVRQASIVYAERGNKQRDSDAWANKGILLNVLRLAAGDLEIFQTHTFYGGGLPNLSGPSSQERRAVTQKELDELVAFYHLHHNVKNVAIITGDFNLNGADVTGDYSHIERTFAKINMRDAWMYPGQLHRNDGGYTCRYTDGSDSENEKDFSNVGAVLAEQDPALSMLTTYCKDDVPGKGYAPPPTREGTGRMDYIFVENPTPEHAYHLDVSRILRRSFPQKTDDGGEQELFLSDHMGLDCTLFLSPL